MRLADDELAALELRAAKAGLSVQRYLVESGLSTTGRSPAERRGTAAELWKMRRDVQGLATNVNQLAMKANATGVVIAGTGEAMAAIARLEERLTEAIDGLSS